MNYVLLPIAFIVTLSGIIVLSGKGDGLIAGYNTASKEEKEQGGHPATQACRRHHIAGYRYSHCTLILSGTNRLLLLLLPYIDCMPYIVQHLVQE